MFYRVFRGVFALALRLFFRLERPVDPAGSLCVEGPVIFVGNHPNGLMDPGLLFVLTPRRVTFLAKAPLFRMPVLGAMLRGLGALPVFRKQDDPSDMGKNEGTLSASIEALVGGGAITLFPEGKSHSEPQLSALKTGCARIALDAAARGADVHIVPVGLTWAQKNRFRSAVHVEVGKPLRATDFLGAGAATSPDAARALTGAIAEALKKVTFNLEAWEDLPIVETVAALYALDQGGESDDPLRQKAFARGMALLRVEQPARFEALKVKLAAFRARVALLEISPEALAAQYQVSAVVRFVGRNVTWLLGLPLFLAGMVLFAVPFWIPPALVYAGRVSDDVESTVKVLTLMLLAPAWWALLTAAAWWQGGGAWALATALAVPPLALFTRYFLERRLQAWRDARTFFVLSSRKRLKRRLLEEGAALAREISRLAQEYGPRVVDDGA